jgi:hypothetical protein
MKGVDVFYQLVEKKYILLTCEDDVTYSKIKIYLINFPKCNNLTNIFYDTSTSTSTNTMVRSAFGAAAAIVAVDAAVGGTGSTLRWGYPPIFCSCSDYTYIMVPVVTVACRAHTHAAMCVILYT